jgi:hypothetical protein
MPEIATSELMSVSSRRVVVIILPTGIECRGGAARRRKVIKFVKGPQYRLFGKRRQRTLWRRARAGRELRSGTTDGRHVDELVTDVDGLGY